MTSSKKGFSFFSLSRSSPSISGEFRALHVSVLGRSAEERARVATGPVIRMHMREVGVPKVVLNLEVELVLFLLLFLLLHLLVHLLFLSIFQGEKQIQTW